MTHIQNFLRAGGTHNELLEKYAIKAKRHTKYPNLVLFKYNQIDSPFAEEIVRECRGIILDEADDHRIVSRAFDKFFNYGEGHAATIDWSTARVQEKLDGSLCVMYFYQGNWHVATSGTPDASGHVHSDTGKVFADLFWDTFHRGKLDFRNFDEECCYSWELTSPLNRIVVVHSEAKITLLSARHLGTQQEKRVCVNGTAIPIVQEYSLASYEDISNSFEKMSPLAQEGYVVVDDQFRRVKVKHPGYVALHHAKDGMTTKAFVEIARQGETCEVITAFPEFKPLLDEALGRVRDLIVSTESDYERLKDIPEQKTFAMEAVKTRCSSALFAVRSKKAESIRRYYRDMRLEGLMQLLGYKESSVGVQ